MYCTGRLVAALSHAKGAPWENEVLIGVLVLAQQTALRGVEIACLHHVLRHVLVFHRLGQLESILEAAGTDGLARVLRSMVELRLALQ